MKTVSEHEAQADLLSVLDVSQSERVVITRDGRPRAVLIGLSDYDEEDIELASSAEFWQLVEQRRTGPSMSLADVKARLAQREANGSAPAD